ncbi:hypothetical protein CFC21_088809 [Triticum aestivum]|uniref:Uncharacterized protein n=3 Tax=Triticum TaxID=4564 RepID=A0A9R1LC38_WHEAT|nr:uncharacterized protein LOC123137851 [Triticum aestivum]KAF7085376.1 hypothetical protein CFC21_088809 [Triticum aestivum]
MMRRGPRWAAPHFPPATTSELGATAASSSSTIQLQIFPFLPSFTCKPNQTKHPLLLPFPWHLKAPLARSSTPHRQPCPASDPRPNAAAPPTATLPKMQRQLNLSPAPKQQQHDDGDGGDAVEAVPLWVPEQSAEAKADKAPGGRPERSIHLIPLLTFLCFLLLFLCSHAPSSSDMSSFGGGGGGAGGRKAGNRRLMML